MPAHDPATGAGDDLVTMASPGVAAVPRKWIRAAQGGVALVVDLATGEGWVSAEDGSRHRIGSGEAVLLAPGEQHESGSDTGMTVVIVQSSDQLPDGA